MTAKRTVEIPFTYGTLSVKVSLKGDLCDAPDNGGIVVDHVMGTLSRVLWDQVDTLNLTCAPLPESEEPVFVGKSDTIEVSTGSIKLTLRVELNRQVSKTLMLSMLSYILDKCTKCAAKAVDPQMLEEAVQAQAREALADAVLDLSETLMKTLFGTPDGVGVVAFDVTDLSGSMPSPYGSRDTV